MKKILIVDDETLIVYALSRMLQSAQTEVKAVKTGYDALKEIKGCFFDLCILDIYLPDMLGFDIMKIIRKTAPATKIIMMTASELDNDMIKLVRDNACSFLSKPFDLSQVKLFVNQLLGEGSFMNQPASNRRQHQRKTMKTPIVYAAACPYSDARIENLKAVIIDISTEGISITTACPLAPGCVLRFGKGIERSMGVVRWNKAIETAEIYRAGIQFI